MDKTEEQKIKELNEIKKDFNEKFNVLKQAKGSLFKLFRHKLEEKKIEEIKQGI